MAWGATTACVNEETRITFAPSGLRRGILHFHDLCERKIMNHFVVKSLLPVGCGFATLGFLWLKGLEVSVNANGACRRYRNLL